ncbi:MAG: hypothetical protein KR126chlam2_01109 [Chlamydiae bacterium]|nr:hypothetical protein [Chlamydiota bacterium]
MIQMIIEIPAQKSVEQRKTELDARLAELEKIPPFKDIDISRFLPDNDPDMALSIRKLELAAHSYRRRSFEKELESLRKKFL